MFPTVQSVKYVHASATLDVDENLLVKLCMVNAVADASTQLTLSNSKSVYLLDKYLLD